MSVLSNFEKGFQKFIAAIDMKSSGVKTRQINESICLMASDDLHLMKKIAVNEWMINRAFSSPFDNKYNVWKV